MTPRRSSREPNPQQFTPRQRIILWLIEWIGFVVIWIIGRTLRVEFSSEPGGLSGLVPERVIAPFWHRCGIASTWIFRGHGIAVMTSRSFDGECIARVMGRFGFVPVRGSSTRGAVPALLGMKRALDEQRNAAFTADGPKGPRYVAKPGPVTLARISGAPIEAFYVAAMRPWILNSWDAMVIPRPFSRVHVRWTTPIAVPRDATEEQMKELHQQMQDALERARLDAVATLGEGAS